MSFIHRFFGARPHVAPVSRRPRNPGALGAEPRLVPVRPAGQVFTPTRPKTGRRQLVGRQAELARILQALLEDRAHVVLYSERGRGKTSLSNLVIESLRRKNVIVARHTCEASSDFTSILRGLLQDLPPSLLAAPVRDDPCDGCGAALPDRELRPNDVVDMPSRLTCRSLVCLVDEFDRVEDPRTRTRLADAIKQLSDRDIDLRFFIVGVAGDLDQILGQHPSIQRSVLGVHLPLFTDRDVAHLISKGGQESGFTFPPSVIARIAALARGMPYIAQLLGLRLAQAAASRDSAIVSDEDFHAAVLRMLGDANPRVLSLYAALTDHGTTAEMVTVLRRVATAPQDPWGRLHVDVTADGNIEIAGRQVSAAAWARLQAANVLQECEAGTYFFSFAERALMHHSLLLAAQDAITSPVADGLAPEDCIPSSGQLRPFLSRA
ncbi:MAG: ATP-binding protein [Acetobacteraceae bacterium]